MKELVYRMLQEEGIEAAAALPYDACRVLRPYLVERLSPFSPQTAILFLVPYFAGRAENLSCYAAARDYHGYMKGLFARLCPRLQAACGYSFYGFADHSPIDERRAAAGAGLGMLGKNGLLIHPRYGSFVFIGELLTDAPPPLLAAAAPRVPKPCCGCGACLRACPTGCLGGSGECLSAITQKKGALTVQEAAWSRPAAAPGGVTAASWSAPTTPPRCEKRTTRPFPTFAKRASRA